MRICPPEAASLGDTIATVLASMICVSNLARSPGDGRSRKTAYGDPSRRVVRVGYINTT